MSTTSQSLLLGAAAVVGLISAATIYLMDVYQRRRTRTAVNQDLACIHQELARVQSKIDQLHRIQQQQQQKQAGTKKRRKRHGAESVTSSEDFMSARDVDSSDLEFYDVSDDDETSISTVTPLDQQLADIDYQLTSTNCEDFPRALHALEELSLDYPDEPEILWRIGKAHLKVANAGLGSSDKETSITRGMEACQSALNLNCQLAQAHKWYALLHGARSEMLPIRERIEGANTFKKHLDIATELDPSDGSLYHFHGRFVYECAELKWYERKVAAALFGEPPTGTYAEAIEFCLKAEELMAAPLKANRLYLAKAYIGLEQYKTALDWLAKAHETVDGVATTKEDEEVQLLLAKYRSYG